MTVGRIVLTIALIIAAALSCVAQAVQPDGKFFGNVWIRTPDPDWTWAQMQREFEYARERTWRVLFETYRLDLWRDLRIEDMGQLTVYEYPDAFSVYNSPPTYGMYTVMFGGLLREMRYSRKHVTTLPVLGHESLHWLWYVMFPGQDKWLHIQHGGAEDPLLTTLNGLIDWSYQGVTGAFPGHLPVPRTAPAMMLSAKPRPGLPVVYESEKFQTCIIPAAEVAVPR